MTDKILPEFVRYPKIKIIGAPENAEVLKDDVVVEEKLDGSNIQIRKFDGEVLLGSRNLYIIENPEDAKMWKPFLEWINKRDWSTLEEKYIIYCEFMRKHTMHYSDLPDICIGLDVFDLEKKVFLSVDDKHDMFTKFGIVPAPIIFTGKVKKVDELKKHIIKSRFGMDDVEGIVIKNYTTQWDSTYQNKIQFAKIVRDEFKEKAKQAFAKPNIEEVIVDKFTTEARIVKAIERMKDEGYILRIVKFAKNCLTK